MKFWLYFLASSAAFALMIAESFLIYPNYFSSLVGIPDSAIKACIVINFAGCLTVLWFQFVTFLFLDALSTHEYQIVYQRGWVFFCNSLLFWGTASMKSQINPYNLGIGALAAMTLLVLHWICKSRVRGLQSFGASTMSARMLFKSIRLAILCVILAFVDAGMCQLSWEKFGTLDFSLFFSIFTIDLTEMCFVICGELLINAMAIYYLHHHEDEDEWDNSRFLTESVHILSSIAGMSAHAVVISKYGIWSSDPGSLFMRSIRAYKHVMNLYKVITAKSELDKFTTSATEAQLARDNTCVICRDEMLITEAANKRKAAKMLRCGHVMHASCLGSWLTRSENCPTCRQPVHSAASAFRDETQEREPAVAVAAAAATAAATAATASTELEQQRFTSAINDSQPERGGDQTPEIPDSNLRMGVPSHLMVPLSVRMTGDNTGLLAERYQFTFNA